MVKIIIPFALIAISACSVLANVPEVYGRETSENDLLARDSAILEERDYPQTLFSREDDTANLQEREPFGFLAGIIGRVATRVGSRVAKNVVKNKINQHQNNRRKRDLEVEDEFDLVAREYMDEEFVERELDLIERETNEGDILEREVEDDLYLD